MFKVNYKSTKTTSLTSHIIPAGNCMFKVNNRNTKTRRGTCYKLSKNLFLTNLT